ncbi:cyclin-dependent kinase inhibitor 7-like [Andrographis paniculata]|uniref:cyclin-dependent kinase inhibitor 7-like n=1 Tax=Andrographis paniculata TaxID=175694 RepID=UPI0021E8DCE0|nr:cyclin-dependent kinase inhibitor 7-like [Andrographis paniculata]XP_051114957.1 cyclin-dependent kinase inhibitor 7-like [Andrographis paniculata]XP_051114958.1 cyclin-dependent kinase inhibitor 7-like [Andrographis paniculata]XP_051114960.1 cyclin-dependent kinase inhibitor 7-like [Andrographis paniculata]
MEDAGETAAAVGRKRKIRLLGELQTDTSSFQIKTRRRLDVVSTGNSASPTNSGDSTCESVSSDHVMASCSSSNGSSGLSKRSLNFLDLEDAEMIPKFRATSAGESLDCRKRRETTPSSEVQADSGELESTAGPCEPKSHRRIERFPSEAELEEFFTVAEANLKKQFIDKYNYDIVKDQPLEGRFEWVQILK